MVGKERERRYPLLLLEIQRSGIHAVPEPCRLGAIVEHVAQVTATTATDHLGPLHAQRTVRVFINSLFPKGLVKAWPAGAAVELGIAHEQLLPTGCTQVFAVFVVVPVLTGEGAFGARLAQDPVLFRAQLLFPLLIAFHDRVGFGGLFGGWCLSAGLPEGDQRKGDDPERLLSHMENTWAIVLFTPAKVMPGDQFATARLHLSPRSRKKNGTDI
jgi:hypothetical protein